MTLADIQTAIADAVSGIAYGYIAGIGFVVFVVLLSKGRG